MHRTEAILHDHPVNEIAAGEASPCTNVLMRAAAQYIEGIEWLNRMHESFATVTGHPTHVVASR